MFYRTKGENVGSVIGLGIGTTACKNLAVAADGTVVAKASTDYPLYAGERGRAAQEPEDV